MELAWYRPTLWLDYDDTLGGVIVNGEVVPGHDAYYDCIRRFGAAMDEQGFDGALAISIQEEQDRRMAAKLGFAVKTRFADSMVLAYDILCHANDRATNKAEAAYLHAIGMSVFTDYPYAPLPGAIETLRLLRPTHRLVVVTKGEDAEQRKKLVQSGVANEIDDYRVMAKKDEAEWRELFENFGFDTPQKLSDTVAIGNSLKSDINPPLAFGANGIFLVDEGNWGFEHAAAIEPQQGRYLKHVNTIADIVPILTA